MIVAAQIIVGTFFVVLTGVMLLVAAMLLTDLLPTWVEMYDTYRTNKERAARLAALDKQTDWEGHNE